MMHVALGSHAFSIGLKETANENEKRKSYDKSGIRTHARR